MALARVNMIADLKFFPLRFMLYMDASCSYV